MNDALHKTTTMQCASIHNALRTFFCLLKSRTLQEVFIWWTIDSAAQKTTKLNDMRRGIKSPKVVSIVESSTEAIGSIPWNWKKNNIYALYINWFIVAALFKFWSRYSAIVYLVIANRQLRLLSKQKCAQGKTIDRSYRWVYKSILLYK